MDFLPDPIPPTVESYLALLSHQYQQAPNLQAWMTAVLQIIQDLQTCANALVAYFDLDGAQGVQLDVLGGLLGQTRLVQFQPAHGLSPILDDATYRFLLRATILKNHWDGTIEEIERGWQGLIPGTVLTIQDNRDMTITVFGVGAISSMIQDLLTHGYVIPRPQAVGMNFVFSPLPYFGFDAVPGYIAGFDTGHWT